MEITIECSKNKSGYFWQEEVCSKNHLLIKFGRDIIRVVDEYTYLGILFKLNGSLKPSVVGLRNIACKAMYSLLKKSTRLGLPGKY